MVPLTKRRLIIAVLTAALGLGAAACGGGSDASTQSAADSGAPASDQSTDSPFAVLDGVATIDGSAFDASVLADSDVLLWFWAPW